MLQKAQSSYASSYGHPGIILILLSTRPVQVCKRACLFHWQLLAPSWLTGLFRLKRDRAGGGMACHGICAECAHSVTGPLATKLYRVFCWEGCCQHQGKAREIKVFWSFYAQLSPKWPTTVPKWRPRLGLCSLCVKFWRAVLHIRAPAASNLLPSSTHCDPPQPKNTRQNSTQI